MTHPTDRARSNPLTEASGSALAEAKARHVPIQALTQARPALSVEDAYEVQRWGIARAVEAGDRVIGYKLGFTSRAKQLAMGIHEPIYGTLLASMRLEPAQPLAVAHFIHPKVEPEIAFILARRVAGPSVSAAEVLAATASLHPALDVLDSRYQGFKFELADVIADNASGAAFVLGPPIHGAATLDLAQAAAAFHVDGREVSRGAGRDVMGHPAEAVAWLARALHARGLGLEAGAVVLSGSLVAPVGATEGEVFEARIEHLGRIALHVERGDRFGTAHRQNGESP